MSSLNQVNIIGRLGQDPEIRYANNGTAVCNLTVATSEKWRDKQTQEQKEETEWHRVVVYGKLAEVCGEYLRKGSLAFFSGSLKTRKWQDTAGVERYTTEIRCQDMKMLGGNPANGGQGGNAGGQQQSRPQPQQQQSRPQQQPQQNQAPQGTNNFDDDAPF